MVIGEDEVVEVLWDFRIRSLRFSAGPININADEYWRVADLVKSGAIKIKATKGISMYDPRSNTVFLKELKEGKSHEDPETRSHILHECTHVISDINKVRVTRLHDEAAAYLAEFSFYKLLDPSFAPLRVPGDPTFALMHVAWGLVAKYKLGQPAGFGAKISASDIFDLGKLVQRNPEYSKIKDEDQLAADGVKLTKQQATTHQANKLARLVDKTKYDNWLLVTMKMAQTSGGVGKSSAYAELRNHFFMVYKPVATVLLHRFSAVKMGDPLSERFDKFSAQEKHELLGDLRVPKPPG